MRYRILALLRADGSSESRSGRKEFSRLSGTSTGTASARMAAAL